MAKYILTESQLKKLQEQGSNSAAMDLDIYVQPMEIDSSNGNEDVEETVQEIMSKLEELLAMFKTGKKLHPELQGRLDKNLDDINKNFENIKYQE
jgi:ribosome-associated translation inhibitor RaiA